MIAGGKADDAFRLVEQFEKRHGIRLELSPPLLEAAQLRRTYDRQTRRDMGAVRNDAVWQWVKICDGLPH